MNINNFEEHIDTTIQKRGYKYYTDENIYDEYEQNNNEYKFEVYGTQDYTVTVKLNENGDIIYSNCDCPYDYGPICKHEVAVYYKLRELLENSQNKIQIKINKTSKQNNKTKTKKLSFEEILQTLNKEQLKEIIRYAATNNSTIENYIILKYSPVDDKAELENCRRLMKSIVRKYADRYGYIEWKKVSSFVSELGELLNRAEAIQNSVLAIDILLMLLEEGFRILSHADDSDGFIGDFIDDIFYMINNTVIDAKDNNDKIAINKMFDKILDMTYSHIFDGWEPYKKALFDICCNIAYTEELREKLNLKITRDMQNVDNGYYGQYVSEIYLDSIYKMLDLYGDDQEVEKFLYEHIDKNDFLEFLIERYIVNDKFDKAMDLISKLEQDKEFKFKGCSADELRYKVYKASNQVEKQRELAKMLLLKGKIEYYDDLKELSNDKNFFKNIKQELKDCKSIGDWQFINIAEEENDLDEILAYVKKSPGNIERFADMLKPKYKDEVIEIYELFIKQLAEQASNRTKYSIVCSKIRVYKKLAGNDRKNKIVNELKILYKRKPAFMDELSKIK